MAVIHGSSDFFYLGLFVWLFFMRLAAADLNALEAELRQAVCTTLALVHLEWKQAAAIMGINESTLGKALRGEDGYPLSLTRLFRLPIQFWLAFTPTLIALVIRKHLAEIAQDLTQTRRA